MYRKFLPLYRTYNVGLAIFTWQTVNMVNKVYLIQFN